MGLAGRREQVGLAWAPPPAWKLDTRSLEAQGVGLVIIWQCGTRLAGQSGVGGVCPGLSPTLNNMALLMNWQRGLGCVLLLSEVTKGSRCPGRFVVWCGNNTDTKSCYT